MTNFESMRQSLLAKAGLAEPKPSKFKPSDLAKLERTEWSPRFETLMRNRLLMGAMRYGTFEEKLVSSKSQRPWDLIGPIHKKIELYHQTGNSEYLVDIANYCMLAFEFDPHPNKHFEALDDHHDHCKRKRDITIPQIISKEDLAVLNAMTGPVENLMGTIKGYRTTATECYLYDKTKFPYKLSEYVNGVALEADRMR